MLLYLLLLLCTLIVIFDNLKCKKMKKLHRECGTNYQYIPLVGHAYKFIGSNEDRMERFKECFRYAYTTKHGIMSLWLGRKLLLCTCNAEAASVLLKSSLDKGYLKKFTRHLVGNGLIFAPVDIWRVRRKMMAPVLSPKYINIFFDVFAFNSNVMTDKLDSVVGTGDFSVWDFVSAHTMASACETTFAEKLNIHHGPKHPFFKAFIGYLEIMARRMPQPWLYNETVYRMLPDFKMQTKMKDVLCDFTDNLIKKIRKSLTEENGRTDRSIVKLSGFVPDVVQFQLSKGLHLWYCWTAGSYPTEKKYYQTIFLSKTMPFVKRTNNCKSFVELLIEFSGGNKGYTNLELREEALVLIMAGSNASATAICFTLVLLSQHPEVQEKVYTEILHTCGDSNNHLSFDDVLKLNYLEAVVNEAMRLYPPAPVIARKCEKDVMLASGLLVHEDTEFVTSIWGIHHNPQYWGQDVEEFKPERFRNGLPEKPCIFMPFGYGPRNCIGNRYSMLLMKITLASILRKYQIVPATTFKYDKDQPLRVKFDIMMKHVDRFMVQIEHRQ